MPEITTELETPDGYDLKRTMSGSRLGAYDPVTRFGETTVALALRTPHGPATIAAAERERALVIEGWGPGSDWLAPHLAGLFGLDDDPRAFTPPAGVVKDLWRRFAGMHLPKFPRVFDGVVRVTLLQVVTWQEACRAWGRLVRELGEPAPGPLDVQLPPSPERLKTTPDYALVALGIRPKQARTILRVAKHASRIETAAEAGIDALGALFGNLPGIGPWTTAYVQGTALGFSDAVLLGDYNLHHSVAFVLAKEPRGSEERMLELLEPYRGHRFRVIRLVWMNGVHAPRRGPRYQAD